MNMIMDNAHHTHQHTHLRQTTPPLSPQSCTDLHIPASPISRTHSPLQQQSGLYHNNNNNNKELIISTTANQSTVVSTKSTLKRSFDVAFLMMPDERIKQKQQQQTEKQSRLTEITIERHQYPTDLSPRSQHQHMQMQEHQLQNHLISNSTETPATMEFLSLHEARRYSQLSVRSPRIYDDPTVVIPAAAAAAVAAAAVATTVEQNDIQPMKSAFTKVTSATRLESPVPPLSPDQLSCPSMSPPMATTPPRTNSGNGSLSNGSNNSTPSCLNPNIVYQSFRPTEYQFNGTFQSVNQIQALQAQRIKQQLLYRPPLNVAALSAINGSNNSTSGPVPQAEFLPSYPGFPFPASTATFGAPEMPRIVQNPAAAAILSTLIPPTLASTFSLTAQNVCAKCNISFRMTSDLVYHMRSHHKSEVACDPNRRKREEKLKCPVCQESFRERHHLTRHMTAHQDKESDQVSTNSNTDDSLINSSSGGAHLNGNGRLLAPTRLNGMQK